MGLKNAETKEPKEPKEPKRQVEIIKEANAFATRAENIVVDSQETYEYCGNLLLKLKEIRSKIKETFGPIVKKAHEAHKEAKAQENKHLSPVVEAENIVKNKIKNYEDKMAAKQLALEQAERKRALEEAEAKKQELINEAEKEAAWSDEEKADALLKQAESVEVKERFVAPAIQKEKGLGIVRTWKFRVIDINMVPREYMIVDEVKVGKIVRSSKGNAGIPGIETYKT